MIGLPAIWPIVDLAVGVHVLDHGNQAGPIKALDGSRVLVDGRTETHVVLKHSAWNVRWMIRCKTGTPCGSSLKF